MKIKWERNSRVLSLAAQGQIDYEDIIPRTTTDQFPAEIATVRMKNLSSATEVHVTLHIKGKGKTQSNSFRNPPISWVTAHTLRVTFGGSYDDLMAPSGVLDGDLTWLDVHNTVTEVKEVLGLK
jgi:hypothetical protein